MRNLVEKAEMLAKNCKEVKDIGMKEIISNESIDDLLTLTENQREYIKKCLKLFDDTLDYLTSEAIMLQTIDTKLDESNKKLDNLIALCKIK